MNNADIRRVEQSYKEYVNGLPLHERLKLMNGYSIKSNCGEIVRFGIECNGYVKAKENYSAYIGDGSHYVYVWKHMDGHPFYVGMGTGDRWKNKSSRSHEFLKEIDAGDSVVYKVVDGIDFSAAKWCERFVSYSLRAAGFRLVNKDNAFDAGDDAAALEWLEWCATLSDRRDIITAVTSALERIIVDDDFLYRDAKGIECFVRKNGNEYFSGNLG